jgi:hypothetical protein
MPELRQLAANAVGKLATHRPINGISEVMDAQLTAKRVKVDTFNMDISVAKWFLVRFISITTTVFFSLTTLMVFGDLIRSTPDYLTEFLKVHPDAVYPNKFIAISRGIGGMFSDFFKNWNLDEDLQRWMAEFERLPYLHQLGYPTV